MLKKSKVVALLVICVMMFAAVEPALARTWGEAVRDTAVGGVVGGLLGAAAVFFTGGAVIPFIAGAAVLGASVGATPIGERVTMVASTVAGVAVTVLVQAALTQK